MSEQTHPATQQEKQPLSPEIMLTTLRKYRESCAERIHEDTETLEYLERIYGQPPLDAKKRHAKIAQAKQEAAALEQTLAILSVLEHPGFVRLDRLNVVLALSHGRADYRGDTMQGALLAAHAALKPQDGATSGKEPTDDKA